ncbi:MAG: hypothetical protein AAFN79_03500 [Pseudomonadota bacterium]
MSIEEEIRDLRAFADAWAPFEVTRDGLQWRATLGRRGEMKLHRLEDGSIRGLTETSPSASSFNSLLATPRFADLERLASAQVFATKRLRDDYVESKIRWQERNEVITTTEAIDRFYELPDSTLVALDGLAGAGKTHLIERITRQRAINTLNKSSIKPLILHVKAGGKQLSSLEDRIDGTLGSELQAGFARSELPTLVRRGLIWVAIDGFDELSDSRGFGDSWKALEEYLRSIDGQGVTIISGRDTFLDQQAILEGIENNIKSLSLSLQLVTVELPDVDDALQWLSGRRNWGQATAESQRNIVTELRQRLSEQSFLRRPFFLGKLAEIGPSEFVDMGGEPLEIMMESFILREVEKWTNELPERREIDVISNIFKSILTEVARSMADYETDVIELDFIDLIIQDAFARHAPDTRPAFLDAVRQKAGNLALLESVGFNGELRSFNHDIVRAYFYAEHLKEHLSNYSDMPTSIKRRAMSMDEFRVFNVCVRYQDQELRISLRKKLFRQIERSRSSSIAIANIGGLLISILPFDSEPDLPQALTSLNLLDIWAADIGGRAELQSVSCNKLDARGSDLTQIKFDAGCDVYEFLLDESTKLGKTAPKAHFILFDSQGRVERRPGEEISSFQMQTKEEAPPHPAVVTLDKLARTMSRQHWVRFSNDEKDRIARHMLQSGYWEDLSRILMTHGFLEESDKKDSRGQRSTWYHLKESERFLFRYERDDAAVERVIDELSLLPLTLT